MRLPRAAMRPLHFMALVTVLHAGVATIVLGAEAPCRTLTAARALTTPARVSDSPAFLRWMNWEQRANVHDYRQVAGPTRMRIGEAGPGWSAGEVQVAAGHVLNRRLVEDLRLTGREMPLAPVHPLATEPTVPGFSGQAQQQMEAWLSASRSVMLPEHRASLKLPTDHPNPTLRQVKKLDMDNELEIALARTEWIDEIDRRLGSDPELVILRDVARVRFTGEGRAPSGYIIRDLSPILDGSEYVPGFSIPFTDRALAPEFSRQLGRAKAKLLLRYGLQMETPNWQNMLQKRVRRGVAADQMVLRDSSDWFFVRPVLEAIGDPKRIADELARVRRPPEDVFFSAEELDPAWAWPRVIELLKRSGVDEPSIQAWGALHDEAYAREISRTLGIAVRATPDETPIDAARRVVLSPEGISALKRFHKKK